MDRQDKTKNTASMARKEQGKARGSYVGKTLKPLFVMLIVVVMIAMPLTSALAYSALDSEVGEGLPENEASSIATGEAESITGLPGKDGLGGEAPASTITEGLAADDAATPDWPNASGGGITLLGQDLDMPKAADTGIPIKPLAGPITNQTELETAIAAAAPGDTITLATDIAITSSAALQIPLDKVITIDGDGHKLIRTSNGEVVFVHGNLTLLNVTVTHAAGFSGIGIALTRYVSGPPIAPGTYTLTVGAGTLITGNSVGISNYDGDPLVLAVGSVNVYGGAVISGNSSYGISNAGVLNLYGGTISGNGRNGVMNTIPALAVMHPGTLISGNTESGVFNYGSFTMLGGEISGHTVNGNGGGVHNRDNGVFTMSGGRITGNSAGNGGGVLIQGADFYMTGGEISYNTATDSLGTSGGHGGGIYNLESSTVGISGGVITGNSAAISGGGIEAYNTTGPLTISGSAEISGNTAGSNGGGVFIGSSASLVLSGSARVSGNVAVDGGGIWMASGHSVDISGLAEISGNTASNHGGGIFAVDYWGTGSTGLANLKVGAGVVFAGNTASYFCKGPDAAHSGQYDINILGTQWSSPCPLTEGGVTYNKGYNNYDISFEVATVNYLITYHLNGGVNASRNPTTYNTASTFPINIANPSRTNYSFNGWTVVYFGGATLTTPTRDYSIPVGTTGDIVLTANWTENPRFTVVYNANGGSGSVPSDSNNYYAGSTVTVLGQGGLTRANYTFRGWATSSGGAVAYTQNQTFVISGNTTLFAVWQQNVVPPTTYSVRFEDWDGRLISSQTVAYGGYAVAPADPVRSGYTFAGWDRSFSYVTANLTIRALYTIVTPTPINVPDTSTTTITPNEPATTQTPQNQTTTDNTANRTVTDTGVPLSSTQVKGQNAWALFNLILAIIGIVLALTACIHALVRNTREKREASEGFIPQSERLQHRNRRMLWFVIAICLGIAGVVVFFLTQDLSGQMVMVDNWTILNAIILVLEIASYVFAFAHSQGTKNTMNPLSVEQNV